MSALSKGGLGRSILTAERLLLGAVFGLWLGDAALLSLTRAGASWAQWALGMGGAALVALSTALLLGALLGPVLVPVAREWLARADAAWGALSRGEGDARRTFASRVLALLVLVAIGAASIYKAAIAALFEFARPEVMATAVALAAVVVAVLLFSAWPWAVRGGGLIVDAGARFPATAWIVRRAWGVPLLLALVGLAASSAVAMAERSLLAPLPWYEAVPVVGACCGTALAAWLPRAPTVVRRCAWGVVALALVLSVLAGALIRPESSAAQHIGFERALSGRAGYAAWTLVLDVDRDGQLGVLGGGDCAPFDARRYTGAPEKYGNGIDEDCDGADAVSRQALGPRDPAVIQPGRLPSRPTVILVTVDALTATELSALGRRRPIMPRLDELASRSTLFTHCFSQGPSTRLSFPSIFTSRWDSQQTFEYSFRRPYSFSDRARTLQEVFGAAGYETVAVIPDVYFDRSRWPSITKGFHRVDPSALSSPTGKHNAREVTDAALRILSEPSDRPLYLWVHYFDAHPPYAAPPGVTPPHKDDHTYYEEELGYIDGELGRLIDAVDQRTEPTWLVFTSDHATSFHPVPESRRFHYGYDIYTSTLHVPLLFHGPGLGNGRVGDVVSTMDIAPTLANLLDLTTGGQFEGTSLAPEILDGAHDPNRVLFHEFYLPENEFDGNADPLELVSARTNDYDLILDRKRGTYELFDWRNDYFEQHGLYDLQARLPEVVRLRSLLGEFVRKFDPPVDAAALRAANRAATSEGPSTQEP